MYSSEAIAEIIPTIQGEIRIGEPVILVRLNGCNLKCSWCDTKYTWLKGGSIPDITDDDIKSVINMQKEYPNIDTLMLTGGEPLLYIQQENFFNLLNLEIFPNIQIETNGTLLDSLSFESVKNKKSIILNVSPKVETMHMDDNLIKYARKIKRFAHTIRKNGYLYVHINIKFVYYSDVETRILRFIDEIADEFTSKYIYIMSITPDLSKIESNRILIDNDIKTIAFCMKYGFMFTPRLHTYLFMGDRHEMMQ